MNELFIDATLENLETVLDFVSNMTKDCPLDIQNKIGLVVDEIFTNIAQYAYHPDVGPVNIHITINDEIVVIEFEDHGVHFDPASVNEPDIKAPLEEKSVGGLGIFMVKKLMDSVEYRREGSKNILTIKKRLA
jgi:anti-sigma regulatory factor (Ser/Thr protein kinase)